MNQSPNKHTSLLSEPRNPPRRRHHQLCTERRIRAEKRLRDRLPPNVLNTRHVAGCTSSA